MSVAEAADRICGETGQPCPKAAECSAKHTCLAPAGPPLGAYEQFDRSPNCPTCGKECASYVGRIAHERQHEDRLPCPNDCGHKPLTRAGMTRHLKICGVARALVAVPGPDPEPDEGPDPWRRRVDLGSVTVEVAVTSDGPLDLLELPSGLRMGLTHLLTSIDLLAKLEAGRA